MSSYSIYSVGMKNTRRRNKNSRRFLSKGLRSVPKLKSTPRNVTAKKRWRPSAKVVEFARSEHKKTLAKKLRFKVSLKNRVRASILPVSRTMKPLILDETSFTRAKYDVQSRHRCQPTHARGGREPEYVSVIMPPGLEPADKERMRMCLDIDLPITKGLDIDEFNKLDNGGYIFIIGLQRGTSNKPLSNSDIFIQPVRSSLELGSVHGIMVERMNIDRVFSAGELRKTDNLIEYNIMSGTFMITFKYQEQATNIIKFILEPLKEDGIRVVFNNKDDSLVGNDVGGDELIHAKRCGYNIELFRNRDKCILDYRYTAAKEKGNSNAIGFLETRRNRVKNIPAENVERVKRNNGSINKTKRLYDPELIY